MGFGGASAAKVEELVDLAHTTTNAAIADVGAVADAVKLKTDNLPSDPADQSALEDILGRKYPFLDFWCHPAADKVTIDSSDQDIVFPSILVAGLPSGLTLVRVVFILTIANLKDTSTANNYINAAGRSIRLMLTGGAWGTNDVIALTLDNLALYTTGSGERGGPVLMGPDLKTTLPTIGNGTWLIQSDHDARADSLKSLGDDLELYDVSTGLRFFYT